MNYETVLTELPLDYVKGIDYLCKKMSISREILMKKCVEELIFGSCCFPIDCDFFDELLADIDEMGINPISSSIKKSTRIENHE